MTSYQVDNRLLSARVSDWMLVNGQSQRQLAAQTGHSQATLSRMLANKTSLSANTLVALLMICDIPLEEVVVTV